MNVSQNVELYSHLFSDHVIRGVRKKGGFIWGHFSDISDDCGHLVNIDETSGAREVARVYDLKRARLKCSLPTTAREIKCVCIATTQRQVLTGWAEHCLSIWDLNTGLALYHFSDYDYPIHSFTLSRDGSRVLTSSLVTGEQSMRVYDLANGKLVAAFTPEESWWRHRRITTVARKLRAGIYLLELLMKYKLVLIVWNTVLEYYLIVVKVTRSV